MLDPGQEREALGMSLSERQEMLGAASRYKGPAIEHRIFEAGWVAKGEALAALAAREEPRDQTDPEIGLDELLKAIKTLQGHRAREQAVFLAHVAKIRELTRTLFHAMREEVAAREEPPDDGMLTGPNAQERDDMAWAEEHFSGEPLDPGIVRLLRIFKENGITTTCQSCEGPDGIQPEGRHGAGHSYRYPTIDLHDWPWKALDVANDHGVQVDQISEVFGVRDGRPVEHFWRIEFNSKQLARFRDSWYGR